MAYKRQTAQSRPVTSEVALLLAACRWPVDVAAVRSAGSAAIDWGRFVALVRRHRVEGLAHHALRLAAIDVPPAPATVLAAAAARIAADNLRQAAETLRLVGAMRAANVAILVIKGVPLSMLAYGTLALKAAWDIDLLVPPDRLTDAVAALQQAGYACILPGPAPVGLDAWHRFSKESIWRNAAGFHVELHTALVDQRGLLPTLDAHAPHQDVAIAPGLTLPTLTGDDLFAYLCVHGAVSAWWRLKWLADVNALLATLPRDGYGELLARAEALGVGRSVGEALLLCQRHLGLDLDAALVDRIARRPVMRWMARLAEGLFLSRDGYDDPSQTIMATLPVHLHGALILSGWRGMLGEIRRKLRRAPAGSGSPSRLRRRFRLAAGKLNPVARMRGG